jgi:hypothetical protein
LISLPAAKFAAQIAASLGVSKIVGDVIRNNVSVLTRFDAFRVWTGSAVITSLLVEQSSNHIDRVVDSVVAWREEQKEKKKKPDLKK